MRLIYIALLVAIITQINFCQKESTLDWVKFYPDGSIKFGTMVFEDIEITGRDYYGEPDKLDGLETSYDSVGCSVHYIYGEQKLHITRFANSGIEQISYTPTPGEYHWVSRDSNGNLSWSKQGKNSELIAEQYIYLSGIGQVVRQILRNDEPYDGQFSQWDDVSGRLKLNQYQQGKLINSVTMPEADLSQPVHPSVVKHAQMAEQQLAIWQQQFRNVLNLTRLTSDDCGYLASLAKTEATKGV